MKKVIILGASRYYSKSIEAAKNAGYFVIALDKNPGSPGFECANIGIACDIADKEGVLKIAIEHKVDGIVPINDVGVPVASYVSQKLNLPGVDEETVIKSTFKDAMREQWIKDGVPCPRVFLAKNEQEVLIGIEEVGLPCILKPAHGLGGASRGVVVIRHKAEIESSIKFCLSFYEDKTTLVESFIEAELEHSAEVLISEGKATVIAISDKVKTPLPYRVDKCVLYPTQLTGNKLVELKEVIKKAVLSLGIKNGAAHVEVATTKDGFFLFELGARCGGGGTPEPIVRFSTGVNLFVELVNTLTGNGNNHISISKNLGCNYHFITPKPGKIKTIKGLDKLKELDYVLDFEFFKKENDEIVEVKYGLERSGFIITSGKNQKEAYDNGMHAESLIDIEYY